MANLMRQWSYYWGRWLRPGTPCICVNILEPGCPMHGSTLGKIKVHWNGRTTDMTLNPDGSLSLDVAHIDVAELLAPLAVDDYFAELGLTEQQIADYHQLIDDGAPQALSVGYSEEHDTEEPATT